MLVFEERGKPEYPEKNLSEQSREPTNSVRLWRRVRESNPGHIRGRRALSPLRQPTFPVREKPPGKKSAPKVGSERQSTAHAPISAAPHEEDAASTQMVANIAEILKIPSPAYRRVRHSWKASALTTAPTHVPRAWKAAREEKRAKSWQRTAKHCTCTDKCCSSRGGRGVNSNGCQYCRNFKDSFASLSQSTSEGFDTLGQMFQGSRSAYVTKESLCLE